MLPWPAKRGGARIFGLLDGTGAPGRGSEKGIGAPGGRGEAKELRAVLGGNGAKDVGVGVAGRTL